MQDKIRLNYHDIFDNVKHSCSTFKQFAQPIKVVSIAKGGLIPSMLVLQHLKLDELFIMGIKSYDNKKQKEIQLYQDFNHNFKEDDLVLVVDDIFESGNTFEFVNYPRTKDPWVS